MIGWYRSRGGGGLHSVYKYVSFFSFGTALGREIYEIIHCSEFFGCFLFLSFSVDLHIYLLFLRHTLNQSIIQKIPLHEPDPSSEPVITGAAVAVAVGSIPCVGARAAAGGAVSGGLCSVAAPATGVVASATAGTVG